MSRAPKGCHEAVKSLAGAGFCAAYASIINWSLFCMDDNQEVGNKKDVSLANDFKYNIIGCVGRYQDFKTAKDWVARAKSKLSDAELQQLAIEILNHFLWRNEFSNAEKIPDLFIEYISHNLYEDIIEQYKAKLIQIKKDTATTDLKKLLDSFFFKEAESYYSENRDIVDKELYETLFIEAKAKKLRSILSPLTALLKVFCFNEAEQFYLKNTEVVSLDVYQNLAKTYTEEYRNNIWADIKSSLQNYQFDQADSTFDSNQHVIPQEEYVRVREQFVAILEKENEEKAEKARMKAEKERVEQEEKERIQKALSPALQMLDNDDFLNADKYIMDKKSDGEDLIAEYEVRKSTYIRDDLRNLEQRLRLDYPFEEEKVGALAATAKHILVQARAGSGKTTLIGLKVRQLIECYGAKPDEILVLAFNRKAAFGDEHEEKEEEKGFMGKINFFLGNKSFDDTNTMTFHRLARRITGHKRGDLLCDEKGEYSQKLQTKLVSDAFEQVINKERGKILTFLYNFFRSTEKQKIPEDFSSLDSYYLYIRNLIEISLAGNTVKSKGEKYIADFLFEHKITKIGEKEELLCEYERALPGDENSSGYLPDFSFLQQDTPRQATPFAILEHWMVSPNENIHPDRQFMSEQQEEKYRSEMIKKRTYCEDRDIRVLETSVDDIEYGTTDCRERFERHLYAYLVKKGFELVKLDTQIIQEKMMAKLKIFVRLHRQLLTFILRAKKQRLSTKDVVALCNQNSSTLGDRVFNFMKIATRVYIKYGQLLKDDKKLDFDDLLMEAISKVSDSNGSCDIEILGKRKSVKDFKYILIDEYQDFSQLFHELIDTIQKVSNASIFCVGDAWQAINAFAGSDTKFIKGFGTKYFAEGRTVLLRRNLRSLSKIVEFSNEIMSEEEGEGGEVNPSKSGGEIYRSQMVWVHSKNIEGREEEYKEDSKYLDAARFLYRRKNYNDNTPHLDMQRCLKTLEIIAKANLNKQICFLFRNNKLYGVEYGQIIAKLREILKKEKVEVGVFASSTTHGYKGKESAVVVVVDASNRRYPTMHPDDELLTILGVTMQKVIDGERNLFYVAVTRAKDKLYLLYDKKDSYSDFMPNGWSYLPI